MNISGYPSIYNLGHKAITDLFNSPVYIQEKVDGSQISFGVLDGILRFRSKGANIFTEAPDKMFACGVEAIKEIASLLRPGWIYRGEFLRVPKHNVLKYNRIPNRHVILFDIEPIPGQNFLMPEFVASEAERLNLEVVPLLFAGQWPWDKGVEEFKKLLDMESVLGGVKIEGMVVKNYALFGPDKQILMGKFVSEAFKEIHNTEWKKANPSRTDFVEAMILSLRTPARWAKAVQHLQEAGQLENSPRDIGKLIKEIPTDIEKECAEDIKAQLYAHFWPIVRRGCIAGVAEWYKDELMKTQFEGGHDVSQAVQ